MKTNDSYDFGKEVDMTTAGTSASVQLYETCQYRLPCGWCSYMCRPCVKPTNEVQVTWTSQCGAGK